jgi:hypothetical protein
MGNYLSCQEKTDKLSVIMETKRRRVELPPIRDEICSFEGYDATSPMLQGWEKEVQVPVEEVQE